MKQLIKHLWENNREEILSRSLLNCHCKGLHSIMLSEAPGKTIRLYISIPDSDMYKNFPNPGEEVIDMSIAFHPHHCNLTLHCIKGELLNWELEEDLGGGDHALLLNKYRYHSQITEGNGYFEMIGPSVLRSTRYHWLRRGYSTHLKAKDIHTVAVMKGELVAWLVYEGKEDPTYQSFCWSNSDLTKQDLSDLYQKPTPDVVEDLLKLVGLLD